MSRVKRANCIFYLYTDSRSGTPMNLSRKSPTSDMAVQTGQSQNQNNQSASSSNNKENQKIPRNQRNNNQRERRDSGRIERNNEVQEQHKGGYRVSLMLFFFL